MRPVERWLRRHTMPPPIDREALREEMARTDPDFRHVRDVQHDAIGALAARGLADGLAIRRERQFWERSGRRD